MFKDIGPILKNWRYVPNDLNVRLIEGDDGKKKIQMRLDLGILQMELDGRPDGLRPHRYDSYLSFYENKAREYQKSQNPEKKYVLTPLDCFKLQQEAIQFYHRYLALMKLEDYVRVARDTSRNLRAFDFVGKYSDNEEVIWSFEQYRPYVIMMHTRAVAMQYLDKEKYDEALQTIQQGTEQLEDFYTEFAEKMDSERFEMTFLTQWAEEIKQKKPLSEGERLVMELDQAVRAEEYERAATLRDQLKSMSQKGSKLDQTA
jgi:hypothetical protein